MKGDDDTIALLLKESVGDSIRWHLDVKSLSRAFVHAFIAKNSTLMVVLLARGAEVNEADSFARTPLMIAAQRGDIEQARFLLLNANACVDGKALILASSRGHLEMVDLLLAAGADVNATTHKRTWSLINAPLLQLYSWFSIEDKTALNYAVKRGHAEIVDKLLQNELAYHQSTKRESLNRALIYASKRGFAEILKRLLTVREIDVEVTDSSQRTPLMRASENGHIEVMKHHTPLWLPTNSHIPKHSKIVQLLLERNVDMNKKCKKGTTALMYALQKGNKDIARMLMVHAGEQEVIIEMMLALQVFEVK